jgi:putative CocE/NonD family hydrolase
MAAAIAMSRLVPARIAALPVLYSVIGSVRRQCACARRVGAMQEQFQAITVDFDVPATMRDGTVLRANIYRPLEGRWPALLTRLPYGKDMPLGSNVLDPVQAARSGYVVIVQDTRGCGTSGGDWYAFGSEVDDGEDTVAWAAALPCCDGQVGMFGTSYFGYTQWAAAIRRPPALKALVPCATWADPLDGILSRGGAYELGIGASWALAMELGQLFRALGRDPAQLGPALTAWAGEMDALGATGFSSLPLAQFAPLRGRIVAPSFFDAVAAPMDRSVEPVASMTILGKHDQVQAPSLNVSGWYDIFLAGTIANFTAMRRQGTPAKLLIGPWSHDNQGSPIGERNFGFASQAGLINLQMGLGALQLRWFDHWLKGRDTGMLAEAPIRIFVMGANVWRDEQEWPLARAVTIPWYLHARGELSPEPPGDEAPDRYTYDPANPMPTRGGALLMTPEYPPGPYDQRPIETRSDVLVYSSAPLVRDVEVTGPITVHLWAASSAPDTDFVARLIDVFPDGRSFNLTDGIVRARYRDFAQGEAPSLIEPERAYEYVIDLWATSNLFRRDHRIRLQITSSCFPRWDRNPNTGHPPGVDAELRVAQQTILHDAEHPSHLVLPVVAVAHTTTG